MRSGSSQLSKKNCCCSRGHLRAARSSDLVRLAVPHCALAQRRQRVRVGRREALPGELLDQRVDRAGDLVARVPLHVPPADQVVVQAVRLGGVGGGGVAEVLAAPPLHEPLRRRRRRVRRQRLRRRRRHVRAAGGPASATAGVSASAVVASQQISAIIRAPITNSRSSDTFTSMYSVAPLADDLLELPRDPHRRHDVHRLLGDRAPVRQVVVDAVLPLAAVLLRRQRAHAAVVVVAPDEDHVLRHVELAAAARGSCRASRRRA